MLQRECVVLFFIVLQCVAVLMSSELFLKGTRACSCTGVLHMCFKVLQYVAACCSVSVLQGVAVCCSVLQCSCSQNSFLRAHVPVAVLVRCDMEWSVAACCSMLQRVAVCFSLLQCVAVLVFSELFLKGHTCL